MQDIDNWKNEFETLLRRPLLESYGDNCETIVLQEIRKLIDAHIPPMLFRMMPCEKYAFDSIVNEIAGTTSSFMFNDPFDTMPRLDGDFILKKIKKWWRIELAQMYEVWKDNSQIVKYYHSSKEGNRKILENIKSIESEEYFVERFNNEELAIEEWRQRAFLTHFKTLLEVQTQTYVGCFTETVDNVLMWSHYARSHSGFALGYDFSLPENQKAKEMLFPVIYSDEKIDMTMDIGFVADMHMEGDNKNSSDILCGPKSSLFKSKDWAYEREWRYTIRDLDNQGKYGSVPLKASAIYYGCNMPKEAFDLLRRFAKSKGLKEYNMGITPFDREYKMNVIEMED